MFLSLKLKQAFYPLIMLFKGKRKDVFQSLPSEPLISIYSISIKGIEGNSINIADYKGHYILIVNVASECGYTPQYSQLQELYEEFGQHLVVLGFPSNEFGGQELAENEQIIKFCRENYKVTFPLAAKSSVIGPAKNTLYQWLTSNQLNGWNSKVPDWNFCKYLVDDEGKLLKYFSQKVSPFDEEIIQHLRR